jgi:hypothetical protein
MTGAATADTSTLKPRRLHRAEDNQVVGNPGWE